MPHPFLSVEPNSTPNITAPKAAECHKYRTNIIYSGTVQEFAVRRRRKSDIQMDVDDAFLGALQLARATGDIRKANAG